MSPARLLLVVAAVLGGAGHTLAQVPTFFAFPSGSRAFDVAYTTEPIVVGTLSGNAFRWAPSTGLVTLGPIASGTEVYVSADGTQIVADTVGVDGITRTSRWNGTGWTQITGLGGVSGTSSTAVDALSGDGLTAVGMGWINAGTTHGYSDTVVGGTIDLGSTVVGRSTRAKACSSNASTIVGWQDDAGGTRQGAMWVGGVQTTLFTFSGMQCGEAQGVNSAGTVVVGRTIFGGGNEGWQWNQGGGLVTLLPNLAGEPASLRASPMDVTDDGLTVVGTNGGNFLGSKALIWINGVPQNYHTYLTNLGVAGISTYTSLVIPQAITGDGKAVCGWGTTIAGGPPGGWVVYLDNTPSTPFCAGDAVGTSCLGCGNNGAAGRGCANSSFANGTLLVSTGIASISSDTLVLTASEIPGPGLFFQANVLAASPITFGDGMLCAATGIIRMGVVFPSPAFTASYPGGLTPNPISVAGAPINPGDTKHYQCWYRDSVAFCTPSTFNTSNGVSLTWGS